MTRQDGIVKPPVRSETLDPPRFSARCDAVSALTRCGHLLYSRRFCSHFTVDGLARLGEEAYEARSEGYRLWWPARPADRHAGAGAGRRHGADHRNRQGPQRRRAAGCHRGHHPDADRVQARSRHRCERSVFVPEHSDRPVPARGDAAGLPHDRADRHRPAGEQQSRDSRDPADRRGRGDDHRDRQHPDGRDAQSGRRSGARQQEDPRSADQRPQPRRSAGDAARLGPAAAEQCEQPQHAGRRVVLAGRRAGVRRGVHARRRDSQQPVRQPQPAASVSRRAPGVPGGNQLAHRAERDAFGRRGERGHQVGHQPVPRRRLRVLPAPRHERHRSVRRQGRQRQPERRWVEAQSVRRDPRWPDQSGSSVLLRRLPGNQYARESHRQQRIRADGGDARR